MRARKLAGGPPAASPPPEEVAEAWPADDEGDPGPIERLCLACGAEGCREHSEVARLDAPSRVVREAVERLRLASAEQRSAARALRVLVLTEVARDRGDLETTPSPKEEPCARCAIHDAEAAAAAAVAVAPKGTARKAKRESGQQPLPFKVA